MLPLDAKRAGVFVIGLWGCLLEPAGGAMKSGRGVLPAAHRALALCHSAVGRDAASQRAALAEGLALAETAVADCPGDPLAHFAVFCTLGRRIELDGLSPWSLGDVRRLRQEIDHVLRLDPGNPDALAAKGALLMRLPGLLGGDRDEGMRLLLRARDLAPENDDIRNTLAGFTTVVDVH